MKPQSAQIHLAINQLPDEQNRQWMQILPNGIVRTRDERSDWIADNLEAIVEATKTHHGKNQMVVDYEHQTLETKKNGKPAPAAGWITGLKVRDNGIWALVEWTQEAARLIREKSYKYCSPVFAFNKERQITRIYNVALTNYPAIDGLAALAKTEIEMNNELAELRTLLGIDEDADKTTILEAVAALKTAAESNEPDPTKYVPIGEFETVLKEGNKLRRGVSEAAAKAHVEDQVRAGALPPYLKDWGIGMCKVSKPEFDAFIERTGKVFGKIGNPQFVASTSAQMDMQSGGSSSLDDEICKNLGITKEEFQKAETSSQ